MMQLLEFTINPVNPIVRHLLTMLGLGLLSLLLAKPVQSADTDAAQAAQQVAQQTTPQPDQQQAALTRQLLVMLRVPAPHYRPDVSYGGGYKNDITETARRRLAEELASKHGLKIIDNWPMPALNINCYVMQASEQTSLEQAIKQLNQDPLVEWAQPLNTFSTQSGGEGLQGMQVIHR